MHSLDPGPSKVTPLHPDRPTRILRRVDWLAEFLDLSLNQTYTAINNGDVPPECVVRVGRRIRIVEEQVHRWVSQGATAREDGQVC